MSDQLDAAKALAVKMAEYLAEACRLYDAPSSARFRIRELAGFAQEVLGTLGAEDLTEEQFLPKVGGISFRCDCGCNVFRKPKTEPLVFVCNSCSARYRGEE